MKRLRLGLALLVSLVARSAHAETTQQEVILGVNAEQMATIVQDMGYRAEVLTSNDGKKRIRTRIGGWNVTVSFYSCEGQENCKSIGLRTFFKNDANKGPSFTNDWNRDKRFAKAYIDSDNDLNIEYDILLRNGVTKGNLRAYFDVYEDQLKEFVEAIKK